MSKTLEKPRSEPGTAHNEDLYAWVQEQVAHLRARRIDQLDFDNIAEELGDVGKSEVREMRSALARLLQHMLKWDHQPERRSRSWALTIAEQRDQLAMVLKENHSLKARRAELVDEAYRSALRATLSETKLDMEALPARCPYTWDEITGRPFAYDPTAHILRS
jgi:hypothetical protein